MCGRRRDLVNLARTRTSLREDVLPERPDRELQSELLRQNYVQFCKLRATDRPKGLDWLRGCRGRPPCARSILRTGLRSVVRILF